MGIEIRLHPQVERVVLAVLADYEMTYEELVTPLKSRGPLEARYFVCWLCKQLCPEVSESEVAWSVKRELALVRSGVLRLAKDVTTQPPLGRRADRLLAALQLPKQVSNG